MKSAFGPFGSFVAILASVGWAISVSSGAGCSADSEGLNPIAHDAGSEAGPTDDAGHDAEAGPDAGVAVPISLRIVNLCGSAVDVYASGSSTPVLSGVKAGDVTTYVSLDVDPTAGALEVRRAGDSHLKSPLATSDALKPSANGRATVALEGNGCSVLPLWETFGAATAGTLRVRFIDTVGSAGPTTPTRLFMEQPDGSFSQVVAVPGLGESGPDGVVVPVVTPDRDSVRVQIGPELSSGQGITGYQIPGSVFHEAGELFVFYLPLSLLVVGHDGPPSEITVAPGDPPGTIRINPTHTVMNAVPDLCGTGKSHFAVSDAKDKMLVAFDLAFGTTQKRALPPTATGHTVTLTPSSGTCTGSGGSVSTGPLHGGDRVFQIVFGSAAQGAPANVLQTFTLPDARPNGSAGPAIAFFNAATGAPSIDVVRSADVDADAGPSTMFSSVAFGTLSPWIPAPIQSYSLFPALRPDVTTSAAANGSRVFVAIGSWDPSGTVALRLTSKIIGGP